MKKTFLGLAVFIVVLLGISCSSTPPPEPVFFHLDRPFTLVLGQTGSFKKMNDFTVRFDKIASDSRCPKGVECITAGQADVALTIGKEGKSTAVTLPFIIPNGTGNVTQFEGYTIRVLGVAPMKFKDKALDPREYNIVVKVTETQTQTGG
jgi:hypothetical protein